MSRYGLVRKATEALCRPLAREDHLAQPFEWVSPPKWHLAHTAWFFETFLLLPHLKGYTAFDPHYGFLFNSYYESLGERAEKSRRSTYSRPTLDEVMRYRHLVDMALEDLLATDTGRLPEVAALVELGLHHEQQHQELLLADIKAILHANPSRPAYLPPSVVVPAQDWVARVGADDPWVEFPEVPAHVGWSGEGFAFDNERPRHRVFLSPFRIARRPTTNGQYLRFIEEGGYTRPGLWLSDGWQRVKQEGWRAPLYWERAPDSGRWLEYGWDGLQPLDLDAPVRHVSYYEADAFARWSGARLPNESEWEVAAASPEGLEGTGLDWEWTASAYLPYPGYRPWAGAAGEYNGKFMIDQMVLRGGSVATPAGHLRPTYRNFFHASTRWQFSGIRLARDP